MGFVPYDGSLADVQHEQSAQPVPTPATYPAPPSAYPYIAPPRTTPKVDGLAIAALVLGIVWVYWVGSILAVIFGAIALKRINASNGWITGKGMAIAGLVLGLVGMSTLAITVVAAMAQS